MSAKKRNLYIAWIPFQRRAESLGASFDLKVCYYYFQWEEKGRIFKLISYFAKGIATIKNLIKYRPDYVFIQLSPTPLLYTLALYCAVTRCRYISDCHNTMIYDGPMIRWPLAKTLLRKSLVLIVHNEDVQKYAEEAGLSAMILRDPLPSMEIRQSIQEVAGIRLGSSSFIIVPGSMARDEPLAELFDAARLIPEALFVMTWFVERLPAELRSIKPDNIYFTGFLNEQDFNALFANASAALVLTVREGTQPSGASEAIGLGVPLIVSDIKTTRRLYRNHSIYVKNESASIAAGVREALSDYESRATLICELRSELASESEKQIENIKKLLPRSV
jgi:glycosyltransferase involved in cell wall biosynthesis